MCHENVKRARSCKSRDGGSNTLLSTPANGRREHLNRQEAALGSPGASSSSSRPAPSVPTCIVYKQTSAMLFLQHTVLINFTRNVRVSQAPPSTSPGKGSESIKTPNPFFSTVCHFCCYQAPVLDKGVASVAAVVATVAEVLDPVRHVAVVLATVAVLATAGKQREAGSGWMDRKQ